MRVKLLCKLKSRKLSEKCFNKLMSLLMKKKSLKRSSQKIKTH